MKLTKEKIILGRTDLADFPLLDLSGIEIKTDTGAYTSSMHCHNILVENDVLKCQFLDPKHEQYHEKIFIFKEFKEKKVKSSNGVVENRFAVKTKIILFEKSYPITLTLTERGTMRFPVLLGRKFLSNKFLIDASLQNLSHQKVRKTIQYL